MSPPPPPSSPPDAPRPLPGQIWTGSLSAVAPEEVVREWEKLAKRVSGVMSLQAWEVDGVMHIAIRCKGDTDRSEAVARVRAGLSSELGPALVTEAPTGPPPLPGQMWVGSISVSASTEATRKWEKLAKRVEGLHSIDVLEVEGTTHVYALPKKDADEAQVLTAAREQLGEELSIPRS